MKKFTLLIKTLVLSALFATAALAGVERVNINTADAATLDRVLNGIGPSKAEAIVIYRKANGPFRSIDQLASVKGIGLSTIEKNRDRIVIAGGAGPSPGAARAGTTKLATAVARPAPAKPKSASAR